MEESRMIIKKTNEEVTFSIKVIHDALHKLVYEIVENVIDELIDKVHEHLMSLIAFMHDEYSCAMKSHFQKFGNQMSGSGNHLCEFTRVMFYLDRIPLASICHVQHQCL